MASVPITTTDTQNAQLGAPLPLAYGLHDVRGNELINHELPNKNRIILRLLGEGEWDGIDRLFINLKLANAADTTLVHFHPGTLGTLGAGLSPISTGGDQGVDSFFNSLPGNFQPLTLSGKAYAMFNVPPDPGAPSPDVDILFHCRTCKTRIFDASGNQTAYQFSTNGAWQAMDLILRRMVKPQWNPALAAAAGGDLLAAEKARFDFPSVADAAAQCDFLLASGQKRFESSIVFPSQISMHDALEQMEMVSQIWVVERGGKIYIRADQPRVSTFVLTSDHVVAGTFQADQVEMHGATNRWIATYRDTNPQSAADIDTPANTGLSRSSNIVTVKTKAAHPFEVNDDVEIVNPTDAGFAGQFVVSSVPDSTHFTYAQVGANAVSGNGYCGTPESRFAQQAKQVDHQQHQLATGQRGLSLTAVPHPVPTSVDLGNNTTERVARILNFIAQRLLGLDAAPYMPPWTVKVQAFMDAVDSSGRALISQLQGDIITIDKSVSEEFQGDYEIKQSVYTLPAPSNGAAQAQATLDLTLKTSVDAYSDGVLEATPLPISVPRTGVAPVTGVDSSGNQTLDLGDPRVLGSPVILVRNPDFESGDVYWNKNTGWSIINDPANAYLGNWVAKWADPGSIQQMISQITFAAQPGDMVMASALIKRTAGTGSGQIIISWRKADGSGVGDVGGNAITSSTYALSRIAAAAPALTAKVVIKLQGNTGGGTALCCDQVNVSFLARTITELPGQLAGSFRNNPVNTNGLFNGNNPLSQASATTTINVAAFTLVFGDGTVSYNSGSVDPGGYGTFYVYIRDPNYTGGTVTFFTTQTKSDLTKFNDIIALGTITTVNTGGGSGVGGGGHIQF